MAPHENGCTTPRGAGLPEKPGCGNRPLPASFDRSDPGEIHVPLFGASNLAGHQAPLDHLDVAEELAVSLLGARRQSEGRVESVGGALMPDLPGEAADEDWTGRIEFGGSFHYPRRWHFQGQCWVCVWPNARLEGLAVDPLEPRETRHNLAKGRAFHALVRPPVLVVPDSRDPLLPSVVRNWRAVYLSRRQMTGPRRVASILHHELHAILARIPLVHG
jgi:hypothetical protein